MIKRGEVFSEPGVEIAHHLGLGDGQSDASSESWTRGNLERHGYGRMNKMQLREWGVGKASSRALGTRIGTTFLGRFGEN